jgi:hypothetical protein
MKRRWGEDFTLKSSAEPWRLWIDAIAQINTSTANGFLTSKRRVSSKTNIQNHYPAADCIHVQSWEREATAMVCLIVFRFRYGWRSTKMIASSVIGSRPWFCYLVFNWGLPPSRQRRSPCSRGVCPQQQIVGSTSVVASEMTWFQLPVTYFLSVIDPWPVGTWF